MPFTWKREIELVSVGVELTDYQVRIDLDNTNFDFADAEANGEDFRFYTDEAQTALLDHWFEDYDSVGEDATVWVEVDVIPSVGGKSIWLFYGDATLPQISNIKNTFLVGDDFQDYPGHILHDNNLGSFARYGTDIYLLLSTSVANYTASLIKSSDNGETWSTVNANINGTLSTRLHYFLISDNGGTFWICYRNNTNTTIYVKKSTDSGVTWGSEITVVSGLTAIHLTRLVYVSSSLLLCFTGDRVGGNDTIRCYQSTDGGGSWSFLSNVHSETSTGIAGLFFVCPTILANGDIVVGWKREVVNQGQAQIRCKRSTDNGSTWSTEVTIEGTGTSFNQGPAFAESGGTLYCIYSSNKVLGATSVNKLNDLILYMKTSADSGATWSASTLINDTRNCIWQDCIFDNNNDLLIYCGRAFAYNNFRGVTFTVDLTDIKLLSDNDWQQFEGSTWMESIGGVNQARIEYHGGERSFVANNALTTGDYIIEFEGRASVVSSAVNIWVLFGFASSANHYLGTMFSGGANQYEVHKRISGAYTNISMDALGFVPAVDTWYDIRVSYNSPSIKVWVDDALIADESDAQYSTGKPGYGASNVILHNPHYFRNYRVRKFSATEPTATVGPRQSIADDTDLSLTKIVDGLLLFEDFQDLTGWTVPAEWSIDTANPVYLAYISALDLLTAAPIGTSDGGGPRDGHMLIIDQGTSTELWYIFYAAGDGVSTNWHPKLAKSEDRGLTWTKLGDIAGISNGTYSARTMGGFVWLDGSTYYLHILNGTSNVNGYPSGNLQNAVYSTSDIESSWTFIRESPILGGPTEFDQVAVSVSWEEKISTTYHVYYSAKSSSNVFSIGHATSPSPDGPYTKDGGGDFLPSLISESNVRPKKWHSTALGKYIITAGTMNPVVGAFDTFYSDSGTNFEGTDSYRLRVLSGSVHGGFSPFVEADGSIIDIDGYIPFIWDGGASATFNGNDNTPDYHLGRKIKQGVFEPATYAAKCADSATAKLLVHPIEHSNFVAEFGFELPSTVANKTVGFAYRMSADNGDNFDGYLFRWNILANTVELHRNAGGTYTLLTSASYTIEKDEDSRNLLVKKIKVVVVGNNHKFHLDGSTTATIDFNDSTYPDGDYVAFRSLVECRIRRFSMYLNDTVTVEDLVENDSVIMRGHGGSILATTTANASGVATLSNYHYPAYSIEVNGEDFPVDGLIWGGDEYTLGASSIILVQQLLSFNQTATAERIINKTATNTLVFTQQAAKLTQGDGSNTLTFNQTVTRKRIINQNINQSLTFTQSATRGPLTFVRGVNQTLTLTQSGSKIRIIDKTINQTLTLNQVLKKIVEANAENTLTLTQDVDRTRIITKHTHDVLVLTQTLDRNTVYNRSINQTLVFGNSHYISPVDGTVITVPNATYTLITDDQLYIIFESGQYSIVLWNPEFGDTDALNSELTIKRTLNNNVYTFIKRNQLHTFRYDFELGREKGMELQQFVKATAGQRIFVKNWRNETWYGNIVTQPINFVTTTRFEDEREKVEVGIEFSGIRIN